MLVGVVATGVRAQDSERWFVTGVPELLDANVSLTPLMTWEDYTAMVAQLRAPRFVPLSERPALSERARYAMNFVLAGKNRSLAVDGSPEQGYRLYLDIDGNGKLTDAEAQPMNQVAGKFTGSFHQQVTDISSGSPESYAVEMTFALDTAIPPGGTVPIPVVRRCNVTVRRGVVHLAGVDVPFALIGHSGIYNGPSGEVVFDLRGRGLDLVNERSPDRFQVRQGKVTIAGAVYAFQVDRYGRGLSLAATDKPMPSRPTLEVNSLAPDFAFTDLDGGRHRLADYRGKVLFLVFWATWCGPCRAEAPAIAEVYRRFKDQGLIVVGVNPNDPVSDVKGFIDQFHVTGPTAREPLDGAVHQLFRVTAWPAHFLIGRDGHIIANEVDVKHLDATVAAAIRKR
jgi:peroxiredoxin